MAAELRKTGISVVGDIPWGTHFCTFYETTQDLLDILVPFFKAGLENNEFCLWIVSNSELLTRQEARNALREVAPDFDRDLSEGRIKIVSHEDWFLDGGSFDLHKVTRRFKEELDRALVKGYTGMRVNGSPAWLHKREGKELVAFEREVDKLYPDLRIIASCTYPVSTSEAAELLDVALAHRFVISRRRGSWEVLETPELIQARAELKKLSAELEQRVIERTKELAAANEALRREIAQRQQGEDRIRLIIDTIPTMAWTLHADGTVEFVNRRWVDYVGVSLEDLIEDGTRTIHPEDAPRVMRRWLADLAAGAPFEDEMRLRRADGEYRWFMVRTAPLRDEQGNIVKWYGVSLDIDDRKRAEEGLREGQQLLQLMLATLPVGVVVTDRAGDIVLVNGASKRIWGDTIISGRQRWEQSKGFWHDSGESIAPTAWASVRALSGGQTSLNELIDIESYDGQEKIIENSAAPIRKADGLIVGSVIVNQDVTERVRAEERLKRSNAELRALSARLRSVREEESARIAREIHDELGGALTSLRWDLEGVGDVISKGGGSKRLAELSERIAAMTTLAETTLDTVRRLASELRPVALDELGLVEAIEWQAAQFQTRTGITVQYDCSLERVDLGGEQAIAVFRILQEALTNILRHAQATRAGIVLNMEAGDFVMVIRDNGSGISERDRSGTSSLGLLGMRERAHSIGGEINIEGGEGRGTTIVLRVPTPAEADGGTTPSVK